MADDVDRAERPAGAPDDWRAHSPDGLEDEIRAFKLALPGWWYRVCECQVSCDASCGPTRESGDLEFICFDRRFDEGFHVDLPQPSGLTEALRTVKEDALHAIEIGRSRKQ